MIFSFRLLTATLFFLLSFSVGATNYVFTGSGDWNDPANWQGGVVPPTSLPGGDTITIQGAAITGAPLSDCPVVYRNGNYFKECPPFLGQNGGVIVVSAGGSLTLRNYTQFMQQGVVLVHGTLINETNWEGYMSGSVTVWGTLINRKVFGNQGTLMVNSGGVVRNEAGTLDNSMANPGTIELHSGGSINNIAPAVFIPGRLTNHGGTIHNTSKMSGNATVSGDLLNAGTLAPGYSPGTYTISGSYTAAATAVHQFEVGGTAAGTYDVLNAGGALHLDGTLNVTLINGFSRTTDHDVILFTGTVAGRFTTANLPAGYYLVYNPGSVILRKMATSIRVSATQAGPYCTGTPVTFTATVEGNPGTDPVYQWKVNGVNAGTNAPELIVTGLGEGQNMVQCAYTCTVSGQATGDTVQIMVPVYSTAAPVVAASGATSFCAGSSVSLSASGTGGYQWYRDGAVVNGATAQTYLATQGGNYSVTVDRNGCISDTARTLVVVYANPVVAVVAASGATAFCEGGSVQLSVQPEAGVSYQWQKDGADISNAVQAQYTATSSGSYSLNATTANGCSAQSAATAVTVKPTPATPSVTAGGSTTLCTGQSVVLSSSAAQGNQWLRDGVEIGGATAQSFTAAQGGLYTVRTTQEGCASAASAGVTVAVNALPATPTITASGNVLTSSAATGNQWYLNGVAISGATGQTYTATSTGQYTVQVTLNGCSATSAAFTFTTTGLLSPGAWKGAVLTYPNPVAGRLFIRNSGGLKLRLQLVDVAGHKVYEGALAGTSGSIDMKGLGRGGYQLLVTDLRKGETIVVSVVKPVP